MKNILVTGGGGYIGSHTCAVLSNNGYNPVVLDILEKEISGDYHIGSVLNRELLRELDARYNFDGIIHLAAFTEVGTSVDYPTKYYENNVSGSLSVISLAETRNIPFVFASSCSIYETGHTSRTINTPLNPKNPYAKSKAIIEDILSEIHQHYVSLRYFNVAGAGFGLRENHYPETHLIPSLVDSVKNKTPFPIFGGNYNTKDGTAVRDYVHVVDVARANVLALEYLLENDGPSDCFNIGTGKGYSVLEIIEKVKHHMGVDLVIELHDRRSGDISSVIAGSLRETESKLDWAPEFDIDDIIIDTIKSR